MVGGLAIRQPAVIYLLQRELWSSDGDYHVPHDRQLELTRALSRHVRENPRTRTAREISRTAREALVLPWGYVFDDYSFGSESRRPGGGLWRNPKLDLTSPNGQGVPYGRVLATAMREAISLIEARTEYDVLFLRENETAHGYDRVRRVRSDGSLDISP